MQGLHIQPVLAQADNKALSGNALPTMATSNFSAKSDDPTTEKKWLILVRELQVPLLADVQYDIHSC